MLSCVLLLLTFKLSDKKIFFVFEIRSVVRMSLNVAVGCCFFLRCSVSSTQNYSKYLRNRLVWISLFLFLTHSRLINQRSRIKSSFSNRETKFQIELVCVFKQEREKKIGIHKTLGRVLAFGHFFFEFGSFNYIFFGMPSNNKSADKWLITHRKSFVIFF